jgi:methionine synthase II (cobalamin-independent)
MTMFDAVNDILEAKVHAQIDLVESWQYRNEIFFHFASRF